MREDLRGEKGKKGGDAQGVRRVRGEEEGNRT